MNSKKNIAEEKAIIVKNLYKYFIFNERGSGIIENIKAIYSPKKKTVKAVEDISFTVNKGELVGFIGPNGAGKTTTLKVLSGLLFPTSGFVEVLNENPWDKKHDFLKKISLVMGQKNQLWWDLPAIETMELNRAIYEIPKKKYEDTLAELTELLNVKSLLSIPVRRLSLGQRMRLEFVASLLHQPELLFLDEPTIGLDVVGQQKIRDFIYDYNKKYNATIILTSHNMADLNDLTKRVIVIEKGNLLYDGDLKALTEKYAKEKIIRVYLSKETDFKMFENVGKVVRINYPQVVIRVPRETAAISAAEILQSFPVADLTVEESPIEDVIRQVFKEEN
jgi:ABC-2 type transport system ATP-binding protein